MTRVLSYNIRLGGTGRSKQLEKMIRSAQPDIVGLVEATDAHVVEALATELEMDFRLTGRGTRARDWQVAVLSRLPILQSQIHTRPTILSRRHLLEVQVECADSRPLTVFVIHLTARVHQGTKSNRIRRAEVRELLTIMAAAKGTPHLVMGDFNSLAPGDSFQASRLVGYALDLAEHGARKKKSSRPLHQRALMGAAQAIVHSKAGGFLVNAIGPMYAQGGIDLLMQAGYVDCFRQLHPHEPGYTFPAATPSTRIDYLFASPELAKTLSACEVVSQAKGTQGEEASDHLPVWAEFSDLR
jgi:endonuclease/exonuclease/phosphatase family metal-dependent hydrolase